MSNLFNSHFWFTIYPSNLSSAGIKIFIGLIAILIIFGLGLKFLTQISKDRLFRRFFRKIQSLNITNIIVLLVLFFLMYESVPFLAGRFWILFLAFINIVWVYYIFMFFRKIPSEKEKIKKEKEYKKYIP